MGEHHVKDKKGGNARGTWQRSRNAWHFKRNIRESIVRREMGRRSMAGRR
jgi:hypothetical protein